MTRRTLALLVAVPALVCAIVGLTHPQTLNASTAEHWRNMHLVLIPIFPLIGLAPWLIARRAGRALGWAGGVFGYGFATFYTALDILAGVGGGVLVFSGNGDATRPVFAIADALAAIGVASLALGCLTAGFAAYRVAGITALPGALLATVGAVLVLPGHIFPGPGTAAMLLLAGGFVVLAFAVTRPALADSVPTQP